MPGPHRPPPIDSRLISELRRDVAHFHRGVSLAVASIYKIAFVLSLALLGSDGLSELEAKGGSVKEMQEAVSGSWARGDRVESQSRLTVAAENRRAVPRGSCLAPRRLTLPFPPTCALANGLRAPPCA